MNLLARKQMFLRGVVLASTVAIGAPTLAQAQDTVTIWVGSWWQSQVPILQEMWAEDHPDIRLDVQPLPINGYLDKFVSAAIGGNPPDVIDLDATWVSTVAGQGLVQPLTDVAEQIDVDRISPAVWAASNYQGTVYAIPNRSSTSVWYYNKAVFDRAGVPYPTAGWDYDDLAQVAQDLTIPGEQFGIGIAADPSDPSNVLTILAPIIWAFGGDFLNEDNTAPAINSPESVKAIAYWSDFYTKYNAAPEGTPNFSTSRDVFPLFAANKIGMFAGSSNTVQSLLEQPDVEWGMVISPEAINRAGGWTMGVPVGASNPEGAKTFLAWLSEPEHMAKVMNRTPANLEAQAMPPWNEELYQIFTEAEPDGRSVPSVAGWFQMQDALIRELQRVLVGQATPQQAADAAAAEIERILAENQ